MPAATQQPKTSRAARFIPGTKKIVPETWYWLHMKNATSKDKSAFDGAEYLIDIASVVGVERATIQHALKRLQDRGESFKIGGWKAGRIAGRRKVMFAVLTEAQMDMLADEAGNVDSSATRRGASRARGVVNVAQFKKRTNGSMEAWPEMWDKVEDAFAILMEIMPIGRAVSKALNAETRQMLRTGRLPIPSMAKTTTKRTAKKTTR